MCLYNEIDFFHFSKSNANQTNQCNLFEKMWICQYFFKKSLDFSGGLCYNISVASKSLVAPRSGVWCPLDTGFLTNSFQFHIIRRSTQVVEEA